jgi:hypothetical protein
MPGQDARPAGRKGRCRAPIFFRVAPEMVVSGLDFGGPAERLLDIFDKLGMQQVALVQTNFDDQEFASRPGVKL